MKVVIPVGLLMTHFTRLGHIYPQGVSFPSPKPSDSLTHLESQGGLVALGIHLLLYLQEAHEVQKILVAQFLGGQLDRCGLFHQEVLVTPFHLGSPVHHHPRQHIGKDESLLKRLIWRAL